jgi:hypothetical protein
VMVDVDDDVMHPHSRRFLILFFSSIGSSLVGFFCCAGVPRNRLGLVARINEDHRLCWFLQRYQDILRFALELYILPCYATLQNVCRSKMKRSM